MKPKNDPQDFACTAFALALTRIEELMAERGMNKSDLAEKMGKSCSTVTSIMRGGNMTMGTLDNIARALEVETWELLVSREIVNLHRDYRTGLRGGAPLICPCCGRLLDYEVHI